MVIVQPLKTKIHRTKTPFPTTLQHQIISGMLQWWCNSFHYHFYTGNYLEFPVVATWQIILLYFQIPIAKSLNILAIAPFLIRKMGHTIRRLLCNMCTHVCVSVRGRVCACVCVCGVHECAHILGSDVYICVHEFQCVSQCNLVLSIQWWFLNNQLPHNFCSPSFCMHH